MNGLNINDLNWKDRRLLILGGVIACLAILPTIVTRNDVINLLILLFLFVALSQSFNLIAGYAGQVNLGHVAFFGVGAMTTRMLWLSTQLPLLFAALAGALTASVFALLIGAPTLRLRGPYFVFGTFALAEILRLVVTNAVPKLSALTGEHAASYILLPRYYFGLTVVVLVVVVVYLATHSKLGIAMKAVREDETAAEAVGIDTFKVKLAAFVLSAVLAGLAGAFFAYYHVSYYHSFTFSPLWTFDAMFITYVGGIGTIGGPILGAIFYVLLREQLALSPALGQIHTILFGILFIAVVLFMPKGIVGGIERFYRSLSLGKFPLG